MSSVELLDEIIQSKFSYKTQEHFLRQFFTFEFYFLTNNNSLNPIKFNTHTKLFPINIENYFDYPMIFTQSLFHALDIDSKGFLSLEEYVEGLVGLFTGSFSTKVKFIFRMFNINNDRYIHIEDIKCILRYTHVFYNKKKIDVLEQIIDDFFGKREVFSLNDFIKRTVKKSSGLFFIVLSILFQHKSFDIDAINFIEDPEPKQNLNFSISPDIRSIGGSNQKHNASRFKANSLLASLTTNKKDIKLNSTNTQPLPTYINTSNYCTTNSSFIKMHQNELYNYILLNFGIELSPSANANQIIEDITSLNDSYEEISIDDEEANEMVDELNLFEEEFMNMKITLLEQQCAMTNEYNIPKGSVIYSNRSNGSTLSAMMNSSRSKRSLKLNILNSSVEEIQSYKWKTPKIAGRSLTKSSFEKRKSNNSTLGIPLVYGNVNNKSFISSFSDYAQQCNNSFTNVDYFDYDVLMQNKKKNKFKKHTLILLKNFIFVMKKNKDDINKTIDSNRSTFNAIGVKLFIPLRKIFVSNIDYHFLCNEQHYCQVTLASTVLHKRKIFSFLFDNSSTFSTFINLIAHHTHYVSINDEFTFVKDIGKGSFSQTKLMRDNKSHCLYAVKKINKATNGVEEFSTQNWEKDIVTFISHLPNLEFVFKCYRIIETYEHLYFVTEYVQGGSLSQFVRKNKVKIPSTIVMKITHQLVLGLKELHSYGIIHRDMKLDNVLIDYEDEEIFTTKIIDFGLSKVLTPLSRTNETYGSLLFCSPEILLSIPYNLKTDIWSLGVIAFFLEYTVFPFDIKGNEVETETSNKIIMNDLKIPKNIVEINKRKKDELEATEIMERVIKMCLIKDINQRPDINKIDAAFVCKSM